MKSSLYESKRRRRKLRIYGLLIKINLALAVLVILESPSSVGSWAMAAFSATLAVTMFCSDEYRAERGHGYRISVTKKLRDRVRALRSVISDRFAAGSPR